MIFSVIQVGITWGGPAGSTALVLTPLTVHFSPNKFVSLVQAGVSTRGKIGEAIGVYTNKITCTGSKEQDQELKKYGEIINLLY